MCRIVHVCKCVHTRHECRELVERLEAGSVEDTVGLEGEAELGTAAAAAGGRCERRRRRLVCGPTVALRRAISQPGHLQVVTFRDLRTPGRRRSLLLLLLLLTDQHHILDAANWR